MSGFARHIPQRASPLLTRRRPVVEGALGRFGASAGGNSVSLEFRILSIQLSNSRPESSPLGVERGAVAACLRHSRLIQAGPLEQPLDSVEVEVHAPPRAHTPAGFRVAPIHRQSGEQGGLPIIVVTSYEFTLVGPSVKVTKRFSVVIPIVTGAPRTLWGAARDAADRRSAPLPAQYHSYDQRDVKWM